MLGAVVAVVALVGAVVVVGDGGDGEADPDSDSNSDPNAAVSGDPVPTTIDDDLRPDEDDLVEELLPDPTTAIEAAEAEAEQRRAEELERATTTVAFDPESLVPALPAAPIGAAPTWTTWSYPVPMELAALTGEQTEIVALTDLGVLHRIELPSGRVRSISTGLSQPSAMNSTVHSSGSSVMLQQQRALVLLPAGAPAVPVEIDAGIGSLFPRGDTGEFLAMPDSWTGDRPPFWLVDSTGRATSLEKTDSVLAEYADFAPQFLPSGEIVVFDAGGTYVVADDRSVRRLSTGIVVANGRNHIVAKECDEQLRCEFVRIDHRSGERTPVVVDVDERQILFNTATVSPDGGSMLWIDYATGAPSRYLIDLESGTKTDVGQPDFGPSGPTDLDNWASDGSGLYVRIDDSLGLVSRDGAVTIELPGLGNIVSITVA